MKAASFALGTVTCTAQVCRNQIEAAARRDVPNSGKVMMICRAKVVKLESSPARFYVVNTNGLNGKVSRDMCAQKT